MSANELCACVRCLSQLSISSTGWRVCPSSTEKCVSASRNILRKRCDRAFQSEQYSALLIELHPRLSCSQCCEKTLGRISRAACDCGRLTVPHLLTPLQHQRNRWKLAQATSVRFIRSCPINSRFALHECSGTLAWCGGSRNRTALLGLWRNASAIARMWSPSSSSDTSAGSASTRSHREDERPPLSHLTGCRAGQRIRAESQRVR